MEFATSIDPITHKRRLLLEFLYELSDELYLLVLLAKNIPSSGFVHSVGLCVFLCNSDFDNSSNPIE